MVVIFEVFAFLSDHVLELFGAHFGSPWGPFRDLWADLGRLLGRLGATLGDVGGLLGLLGRLGSFLAAKTHQKRGPREFWWPLGDVLAHVWKVF